MDDIKISTIVYVPDDTTDDVYEGEVTAILPDGTLLLDDCYEYLPSQVYLTEEEAIEAGECMLEENMINAHYASCGGYDPTEW